MRMFMNLDKSYRYALKLFKNSLNQDYFLLLSAMCSFFHSCLLFVKQFHKGNGVVVMLLLQIVDECVKLLIFCVSYILTFFYALSGKQTFWVSNNQAAECYSLRGISIIPVEHIKVICVFILCFSDFTIF